MNLNLLNPAPHSAAIYEFISRSEERIAYDSRLLFVLSGGMSVTVDGEKLGRVGPGELIYIPAGVPYTLRAQHIRLAVITFDLTHDFPLAEERIAPVTPDAFNPGLCRSAPTLAPFDKSIFLSEMESERDTLTEMCNLFTSAEGYFCERISAMLKLELVRIAELVSQDALPSRMVDALDAYIRENVGDDISNTEIGAIFGYHPFYVSRLLKQRKGVTLRQYIISYRLRAAKKMLELSAKSVGEIAEECGFSDASYFTKSFKTAYGVTPKEYRNCVKDEFI